MPFIAHWASGTQVVPGITCMIYELMYIIPSRFSDSEIDGVVNQVSAVLEKRGAKIEQSQNLGKIKFAYPIKKVRHGTYILSYIEVAGEAVSQIDADLRLTDEVLRHLLVKCEKGIPGAQFTFKPTSYEEPMTAEGKRTVVRKPRKLTAKTEAAEEVAPITEEDLDRKLDQILEEDLDV